ncbi:MAG: transaldolase [Chloroflexi bacterium]|jgi:transaldolase|nr:transaldolase [Chloroflexota bacterium]
MKLWLASANPQRVQTCLAYGVFTGVITNPHVVAQEGRDPKQIFADLCQLAPAAYYQLQAGTVEAMQREAETMLAIDPERMRIKVPATRNGLAVIRRLSDQGLPVMATAVPTNTWMVLAVAAGAVAVAPYSGMLQRRHILPKMEGVFAMQAIIDRQNYPVELCTGIYDATEIAQYAARGVKSAFLWDKDVETFLTQELADEAAANFNSDWAQMNAY